ncbi:MAG: sugar phosphate isomerase/epimerase [Saprospiraceae bacterium]|nr:sugar phosphate isomerase/epimerase [Saprospiraceae bacterium]
MDKIPRREFLKNSALALAGTAILPDNIQVLTQPVRHLGVQLYSVRGDMAKDPVATLKTIAEMGYSEVEGYGYQDGKMFGMPFTEYTKILTRNGLSMPSSHCGFSLTDYVEGQKSLSDRAKRAIDDAAAMGQKYIIYPWVPVEERSEVEKIVNLTAAGAAYAQKAGIRFGYHNHDFEFIQRGPDGRLLIEWLLHEIDPQTLAMEMDIYWVCYAQYNPLDWFRLYPGRWELCHAKDLAATDRRETIEFGDGAIDFPGIFRQSKLAGLQHYIIELEHYRTTPLEGVKRARENFLNTKW